MCTFWTWHRGIYITCVCRIMSTSLKKAYSHIKDIQDVMSTFSNQNAGDRIQSSVKACMRYPDIISYAITKTDIHTLCMSFAHDFYCMLFFTGMTTWLISKWHKCTDILHTYYTITILYISDIIIYQYSVCDQNHLLLSNISTIECTMR